MARSRSLVVILSAAFAAALVAQEQPRPEPPKFDRPKLGGPRPEGGPRSEGRPDWPRPPFDKSGPDGDAMRERATKELEKLTPEQRGEIWRSVWAVLKLPADKRQALISADDDRRKKAREEIEQMLKENGIQIEEARRHQFIHRYFDERRGVEEKLRKEEEARRAVLVKEMNERLVKEFGAAVPAPEVKPVEEK